MGQDPLEEDEVGYQQAKDKKQAARQIMSITDYPAFLKISGYAESMKQSSRDGV